MNAVPLTDANQRIELLLREQQRRNYAAIDRMFRVLMLVQWVAAVAAAYWISPLTWAGMTSTVHPHVWLALGLGGAIAWLPLLLDFWIPGRTVTRYANSVAQVLFSALLIHVTGGRIETHFHVFGSLAFLACYRDWKVLIPATVIVAVDHFVRGVWWPESVFGVASASSWRWLEHAGWVLFEDVFLTIACVQGVAEMRSIAARTVMLEETDRWKTAIFEAALDAVVSMDREGRVTEWNSKAETMFGWTASEAIGQPLSDMIIPMTYRARHIQGLKSYLETRHGPVLNQRIEVAALRRDGTEFPVELAITPIQSHGQLGFCGFIRDITARRRDEQELLRAKETAEAANLAKSNFLAHMSHEIRTPLNGILGFTDLLRRKVHRDDEEKQQMFIDTIARSGRHLLTVINDVLDLSKIEAGQVEIERARFKPVELLAEVVSILRVTAQEKGLVLNYFWTCDPPSAIESDPVRLRQILMNLVGNAVKFTEHGSVTIHASLVANRDGTGHVLKFTIKDTGPGIPVEKQNAIFEPFVQVDSSVTRKYGGTGLGLSICKLLCQLLGGSIQVESHVGFGSVFTFTVDAGIPEFSANICSVSGDVIQSTSKVDACAREGLTSKRILLVEDGEINRQLLQIVLQDAGMNVALAENGKQGLDRALQQPFDAILLDMQMPVMDGYTAAAEMRRGGVSCPIVALTAHAMSGDAEKCFNAGCSHYLSKPVEADRLLQTLDAVLKNNPQSAEPKAIQDKTGYGQIVDDYVQSLTELLDSIETACRNEDVESLCVLTHKLKGSGGTVLSEAAEQFEREIRNGEKTQLVHGLDRLKQVIDDVVSSHAGV
jgi:two-component system sensor histidine kinase/response regulator